MGTYFRKSVKIAPGVRLNFSKTGMSMSAGPKGAKVNISKRGTYLTTGVPGTGVYSRKKISASNNQTKRYRSYSNTKFSEGSGPFFGLFLTLITLLLLYWTYLSYANSHWILGTILLLLFIGGVILVYAFIDGVRDELKAKKATEEKISDLQQVADVGNDIWTHQEAERYSKLLDELNEECDLMDKSQNLQDLDIHYSRALSIFAEFEKTTLQLNDVSVPEAKEQLISAYEEYKKNQKEQS